MSKVFTCNRCFNLVDAITDQICDKVRLMIEPICGNICNHLEALLNNKLHKLIKPIDESNLSASSTADTVVTDLNNEHKLNVPCVPSEQMVVNRGSYNVVAAPKIDHQLIDK